MSWQRIVFFASILVFAGSLLLWIVFSVKPPREKNRIRPFYWFFWGFFLSSILLLLPLYHYQYFKPDENNALLFTDGEFWRPILPSVHHAIQMLQANADSAITRYCVKVFEGDSVLGNIYYGFLSAEYVLAPILTAGVILSFFKSVFDYVRYYTEVLCKGLYNWPRDKFRGKIDVYVFSALNEKSLALASSIRKKRRPAGIIIFTDVSREIEDSSSELVARAKKLRAICFRKDILSVNFFYKKHLSRKYFFVIGDNETENVNCAYELLSKYSLLKESRLYVFTMREECEYLIKPKDGSAMEVRRINVISSLVYHNLYQEGYTKLFESAIDPKNGTRKIGVVIAGLGHYGMETLKAIAWYCQMTGYSLTIDAFDKDSSAEDRLKAECPELMPDTDHYPKEDGTSCTITVHPGTDVHTHSFFEALQALKETTYVLVSLGSDEENIRTAIDIRTFFAQTGVTQKKKRGPIIQAIVYTAYNASRLDNLANYKKEPYNIDFFGNADTIFDEETVMNSDLESKASELHAVYFDKHTFYEYEYYYRSSCAGVIHAGAIAGELYNRRVDPAKLVWADRFLRLGNYFSLKKSDDPSEDHFEICGENRRSDPGYKKRLADRCKECPHKKIENKSVPCPAQQLYEWANNKAYTGIVKQIDARRSTFTWESWENRELFQDAKSLEDSLDSLSECRSTLERILGSIMELDAGPQKQPPKSSRTGRFESCRAKPEDIPGSRNKGENRGWPLVPDRYAGFPESEKPITARYLQEQILNGMPEKKEALYYLILVEKLKEQEHKRWNVYMRSEGYIYGDKRFDLGKIHHDLKPYSKLPPAEQNKDIRAGLIVDRMDRLESRRIRDTAAGLLDRNTIPCLLERAYAFLDLVSRFPADGNPLPSAGGDHAEKDPAAQLAEWMAALRRDIGGEIRGPLEAFTWDAWEKRSIPFSSNLDKRWTDKAEKLREILRAPAARGIEKTVLEPVPDQNSGVREPVTVKSVKRRVLGLMAYPPKYGFPDHRELLYYILLIEKLKAQESGNWSSVKRTIGQTRDIRAEKSRETADRG